MPRYPYRQIGVGSPKQFRNDQNKNLVDIASDIAEQKARVDEQITSVEQPSEVVDARVDANGTTYDVLKDRLDSDQQKVASQLADKANQTYVDQVLSVVSSGGPDEIFYSISALNTSYPSGANRTKLVFDSSFTDGAHSFIWNGTAWKDVGLYQGIAISDGSVTPQKTSFISNGYIDSSIYPLAIQDTLSKKTSGITNTVTTAKKSFIAGLDDSYQGLPIKDGANADLSFIGSSLADQNIAQNGDFSNGTNGWSADSSSLSVADNILSVVGNGAASYARAYQFNSSPAPTAKRLFINMDIVIPSGATKAVLKVVQGNTGLGSDATVSPLSVELDYQNSYWTKINGIFTLTQGAPSGWSAIISFEYPDSATASGKVGQVRNVIIIDMGNDTSSSLYNLTLSDMLKRDMYVENITMISTNNQFVLNGDLSNGMDNWSGGNHETLSINSGVLSAIGNGSDPAVQAIVNAPDSGIDSSAQKLFLRMTLRVTDSSCEKLWIDLGYADRSVTINNPVANNWYTIYGIISSPIVNIIRCRAVALYADATTQNGKTLQVMGGPQGAVLINMGFNSASSDLYDLTADEMNSKFPTYFNQIKTSRSIHYRIPSESLFSIVNGIAEINTIGQPGPIIEQMDLPVYNNGRIKLLSDYGTISQVTMTYLIDVNKTFSNQSDKISSLNIKTKKAFSSSPVIDVSNTKEYNPSFDGFNNPLTYTFAKKFTRRDWYTKAVSLMLGEMDLSTNPFNSQSNIYNIVGDKNFTTSWANGHILFSSPSGNGMTALFVKKYFPFSTEEIGIDSINGNAGIGVMYGDNTRSNRLQVVASSGGITCSTYVNGTLANSAIFSAPDFTGSVLRVQNTGRSLLIFRVTATGWDWVGRYWYKTYLDARQLTFLDTWKTYVIALTDNQTSVDFASFNSFSSRLSSGSNSVSIRFLTYEDGTFIQRGNYMYYLAEGTGTTIGDLYTQICRINFQTGEVQMIGGIFQVRDDGVDEGILLGDDSIKAVYDRQDNKWKMISCGMEYYDEGNLNNRPKIYSETTADLLAGGIIIVKNGKQITFPGEYVEDIDFYYDNDAGNWRLIGNMVNTGAKTFRTADNSLLSSISIETTGPNNSNIGVRDTGNQFVKFGDTRYITAGGTGNKLHLRDNNLQLLGEINLDYQLSTTTNGPWCTLCPYKNGDETELYLLTFDRSDLLEGLGNGAATYDHGGLYVYKASLIGD